MWLGVLLAVSASGAVQSLAVAGGALGALGAGVLAATSPAVASAVLLALAFAERTTRVRGRTARAVHVGIALVGGALAGSLSSAFALSSIPVFAVAVIVAAVLSALPLLVEADDPIAHALDTSAELVSEPARGALRQGAELRREAEEVPLDRITRARVRKTWQSLLRLAEARVRLERTRPRALVRIAEAAATAPPGEAAKAEGEAEAPPPSSPPASAPRATAADAVLGMVDQRIAEHVSVLARALAAVDTARAAAIGLDDVALKNVESMGDSLEEVSRAMVEVKTGAAG